MMKFQLNPLAETFVPSQYTKNDSLSENTTLAKYENKMEFENVKAHKSITKPDIIDMLMLKIQRLGINVELLLMKKSSVFKDDLFSWIMTSLPKILLASQTFSKVRHLENSTDSDTKVMSVCSNDHDELGEEDLYSSPPFSQTEKEECDCPAIFGWIVPPDFFGNPLKLKYNCNKRYAHISSPANDCADNGEAHDLDTNHQFKSEVEDKTKISRSVIGDRSSPELEKFNDLVEIQSDSDLGTYNEDNLIPNPALDLETSDEFDLIDDGCHPLLQSDTFNIRKNDECLPSIQQTEKILEKSFSTHQQIGKKSSEPKSVCNPPCSVWCEDCPPAAKDTFKKFLKEKESKDVDTFVFEQKSYKRQYFRSFSSNDVDEVAETGNLFRTFSVPESVRFTGTKPKPFQAFWKTGNKKCFPHPDVSNGNLSALTNTAANDCNKWGPFDGADSLWKPLPECIPTNDNNQKHINYKRAREMKRQKSLS